MKFIKLLWFDFRNGTLKNPVLLPAGLIFPLLFCIDMTARIHPEGPLQPMAAAGFADYFVYAYGGMKEYIPGPSNLFWFPAVWTVLMLSPAFATLSYPLRDIQSFGQQVIYRTQSRRLWWLSKCVWNLISTLLYHAVAVGIIFLFCFLSGLALDGTVHKELLLFTLEIQPDALVEGEIQLRLLGVLTPVLISAALNLLQMTLSMFIKPVFSFFVTATIAVSSAYLLSPFLFGNYAMVSRSSFFLPNGVSPVSGLALALALLLISGTAGMLRFRYYDILNKE